MGPAVLCCLCVQDPAYWASWAISHWSTMAVSGALCALVGTYPFSHSSATLLLAFYWLVAAVRRLACRLQLNCYQSGSCARHRCFWKRVPPAGDDLGGFGCLGAHLASTSSAGRNIRAPY